MQPTDEVFSGILVDNDPTTLSSQTEGEVALSHNHETDLAQMGEQDLGRSIQAGVEAVMCTFDTVLSTCLSLDGVLGSDDSTSLPNKCFEDSMMSPRMLTNDRLSTDACRIDSPTQTKPTDESSFQRRGRFLVWPASLGYDFDTNATSRT